MDYNKGYEFMPIAPINNNAIPDAMKDFICKCGIRGIVPFEDFSFERDTAEVLDFRMCSGSVEPLEISNGGFKSINGSTEENKNDETEDEKVNRVLSEIEKNNLGVMKFLEVNGMSRERAKKFIKRVVRLSIRYE